LFSAPRSHGIPPTAEACGIPAYSSLMVVITLAR
jgi:hypothetical protein